MRVVGNRGLMAEESRIRTLERSLQHPSAGKRLKAVEQLGASGERGSAVLARIVEDYQNHPSDVVNAAAKVLFKPGGSGSQYLSMLLKPKSPAGTREAVISAIREQQGREAAVSAVRQHLAGMATPAFLLEHGLRDRTPAEKREIAFQHHYGQALKELYESRKPPAGATPRGGGAWTPEQRRKHDAWTARIKKEAAEAARARVKREARAK